MGTMTLSRVACWPISGRTAATSRADSSQSRLCQSSAGSAMALTCSYAFTGKNAGLAWSAWPVVTASQKSWMRFLNAVSVVLGSVRVCGRVAALGGATRSAAGLAGGGGPGLGFGFGLGCAAAAWPTVAAALAVTDAVLPTVAAGPVAVAAQPVRAPAASTAPIVRHLTTEGHTRIGGACTLRNRAVPAGGAGRWRR